MGTKAAKKSKKKATVKATAKVGRPSSYKVSFNDQAEKLCKLGATDTEMAEFFGCAESTLNLWKLEHPEFSEAIKRGKMLADASIAERLYQRAMGFEHDSEEIKVVSIGGGEGSEVVRVPVKKIYPPDSTAAIFWLKNRQRSKWGDKAEVDITSKGEKISSPLSDAQFNKLLKTLNDPG